ncbi:MAG: ABC transporter permease [Bryobacteraceae bacterium]
MPLLLNVILQGLTYGVSVMGISISLRVLRYPDLTADGSFLLGAVVFARLLLQGVPWGLALLAAIAAGGAAGMVTAVLHTCLGVGRLLSGILTTMGCYSLAFRVLGGRPNVGTGDARTMFSVLTLSSPAGDQVIVVLAAVAIACALVLWGLESETGLILRATGDNRPLLGDNGHHPARYEVAGLFVANGLVAASGALVCAEQGFADLGMGVGIIVTLIAALVLGEQVLPFRALWVRQCAAPIMGASLYYLLYLGIVRASVRGWLPLQVKPTDLKIIAAVTVVLSIVVRRFRRRPEGSYGDILPL